MGKRKKRKIPAVPAHRVPTNLPPKRKLIDTIDREKYNLVDLSGSESDSDLRMGFIPNRRHLSTGSRSTNTDSRRIDLNHSRFSPVKQSSTVRVKNSHPSKGHHNDARHSICVGNPAQRAPSSSTEYKRTMDKKRNSSRLPDNGPEISTLVEEKHSPLKSEAPGVGSMLKSVVSSVLNAPDIQAMISSIPAGKDRDELLKRIVEEQLTESFVKNSELLKQLTQQESQDVRKTSDNLAEPVFSEPNEFYGEPGPSHRRSVSSVSPIPVSSSSKFQSIESKPRLSLLGCYISNLFDKNEIKYRDEGSSEKSMMLLIDYQAKFLLREGKLRVLPLPQYKADIVHELYCGSCRREFSSITVKADHEYSYLHQIITGEWWKIHSQPPKFLPLFSTSRRERIFIWCIICFEKHGVDSNEDLYQHLKSTHHQFNLCSWKECYNAWPQHEWCLWKDVESIKHSLPRSTVNGFDWPKEIECCVLPDYRMY